MFFGCDLVEFVKHVAWP